jgi:streptogramin lyase
LFVEPLERRPLLSTISEFPIPTANSDPVSITTGPDGNLWFTEEQVDKIGMINPTTHVIEEFPIPTANSGPQGITTGPDGNLPTAAPQGSRRGPTVISGSPRGAGLLDRYPLL